MATLPAGCGPALQARGNARPEGPSLQAIGAARVAALDLANRRGIA
ncbi:hypothetical protein [Synechococcus sp. CS-1328]|nr:hypothetical protein [Synechococcus sp. CS-1328]MCT0226585.1 hypothetical protein [Synechococcus sp. CS-1328]